MTDFTNQNQELAEEITVQFDNESINEEDFTNQSEELTEEESKGLKLLDAVFNLVVNGVPPVSPPLADYTNDYYKKYDCPDPDPNPYSFNDKDCYDDIFWIKRLKAIRSMLNHQKAKCTVTGIVTGLGGAITLPITIPADLLNTFYIQMRMVVATAQMAGYTDEDIRTDQFRTFCYAIMVGVSISQVCKKAGINLGVKVAGAQLLKLPSKVLKQISKQIGIKITKSGLKSLAKSAKLVPIIGSIIGGGWNYAESSAVAKRAWKTFIEDDPRFARIITLMK